MPDVEMAWYIPLIIFAARIGDVSIGTFRMILVVAGQRYFAALLGFFEVIIWILAVGGAITYLKHPAALIGYAGGFAAGTLVGMFVEDRVALGFRVVRIIVPGTDRHLCAQLRERGWRVTRVDGTGRDGPVEIAFMVIRRRELQRVRDAVHELAPSAFITVERAERPIGSHFSGDSRFGRGPWRALVRK